MEASNVKAMREALNEIRSRLSYLYERLDGTFDPPALKEVYEIARTALSAPPRNCDVGTAEEQEERFTKFCRGQDCKRTCPFSDDYDPYRCEFAWGQMPYEEGEYK